MRLRIIIYKFSINKDNNRICFKTKTILKALCKEKMIVVIDYVDIQIQRLQDRLLFKTNFHFCNLILAINRKDLINYKMLHFLHLE
jgi:hypothetical protein